MRPSAFSGFKVVKRGYDGIGSVGNKHQNSFWGTQRLGIDSRRIIRDDRHVVLATHQLGPCRKSAFASTTKQRRWSSTNTRCGPSAYSSAPAARQNPAERCSQRRCSSPNLARSERSPRHHRAIDSTTTRRTSSISLCGSRYLTKPDTRLL